MPHSCHYVASLYIIRLFFSNNPFYFFKNAIHQKVRLLMNYYRLMEKPPSAKISIQEGQDLLKRIESRTLKPEDFLLVSSVIRSYLYVQWCMNETKIGWNKLRNYFGLKPRSRANDQQGDNPLNEPPSESSSDDEDGTSVDRSLSPSNSNDQDKGKKKKKARTNGGKYGFDDYASAPTHFMKVEGYQAGDDCPCCQRGKLYPGEHRKQLRFSAHAPIEVDRYLREALRCNRCGQEVVARLPQGFTKWTPEAKSKVVLYGGKQNRCVQGMISRCMFLLF
jgi:hypothetical protein